jgi:exodeoxyribonuclease X
MIIRCVDLETTSLADDAAICEAGYCDVVIDGPSGPVVGVPKSWIINPGRPIDPEAMAVHHISDEMAAEGIPVTKAFLQLMSAPPVPEAFCAHYAAHEKKHFTGGTKPWICTMKLARRLFPDAPSHSLQVLRYALDLRVIATLASPTHRAGPDAYVTAELLARIMRDPKVTYENAIKASMLPSKLPRVPFGKHVGLSWADVPADYLDWLLKKKKDFDADLIYTVEVELNRRRSPPAQKGARA